ncbi:hypothetical protein, partial [Peribacillus sp. NPDC096540]|uniref:hypothetical protein n=1 Tax=Peribacillus sp. NPDC096540 TaxID=3390612 RepID=UPI003D092769
SLISFWSFNNVPSKSIAMKLMLYSSFSHSIYKILFLAFLPAINKNLIKKESTPSSISICPFMGYA